ncbi:Accessory gene regulator B [Thermoanaerobacter mathranii subsp. mathranii str. A3]|uniref:Accessory gene regulator B n=1 Tax=Thermoanaerobacter mathranii subsp. mathranii (strain DSM 11426 / CCUG 53645 / CIP 108742 / A3) TaxID=583358 RepID=A0ABM5LNM8_THEM3|nr:Accessory gene regulator B [Thermoanaerobacter mathranii subsp. mathranii str. A3]
MEINIEKLAETLAQRLFKTQNLTDIEMAKIQYGISLILGVIIEFTLVYAISLILGIGFYTAVIMFSALFLRINTGGAHCTTYNRCITFTAFYFIPFSALAKFVDVHFSLYLKIFVSLLLYFIVLVMVKNNKFYRAVIMFLIGINILLFFANTIVGVKVLFLISIGFTLQAIMRTTLGETIVEIADAFLKKAGI